MKTHDQKRLTHGLGQSPFPKWWNRRAPQEDAPKRHTASEDANGKISTYVMVAGGGLLRISVLNAF